MVMVKEFLSLTLDPLIWKHQTMFLFSFWGSKSLEWRAAMKIEFDALMRNQTWELVPRDPTESIVDCKWLFSVQRKTNDIIDRYKAYLVVKGFTLCPGIDYHATFSPIIKPSTMWLVLLVAIQNDRHIHQFDVNNAFLHGCLDEEVFLAQPEGLDHPDHPSHVSLQGHIRLQIGPEGVV